MSIEESLNTATGSGHYMTLGLNNEELATFGAGCYWGTEKWFVS